MIGVLGEDLNREYIEACNLRILWKSLEADARAVRNRIHQRHSLEELGPNETAQKRQ